MVPSEGRPNLPTPLPRGDCKDAKKKKKKKKRSGAACLPPRGGEGDNSRSSLQRNPVRKGGTGAFVYTGSGVLENRRTQPCGLRSRSRREGVKRTDNVRAGVEGGKREKDRAGVLEPPPLDPKWFRLDGSVCRKTIRDRFLTAFLTLTA